MKYVVLSFDDAEISFYTRALDVLKKYNLDSVLNVISSYTNNNNPKYLSWNEIKECEQYNVEIACHSESHCNEIEDIIKGVKCIKENLGISTPIGFASPHSDIYRKNFIMYKPLLDDGVISYIRSGNCIKRDGLFHAFLYLAYKYTRSKRIFSWYNKRNVIKLNKKIETFYPSITCNNDNSIEQIIYAIEKMPKDSASIIMFHNILKECDEGYKKQKWSNTLEEFETLCKYLSENKNVEVITNKKLNDMLKNC